MKRLLLFCGLIILTCAANAQNSWQGGIRLGVGNNFLISSKSLSGNSDSTGTFSVDYSVGVSVGWFPNRRTYYSHKLKGLRIEAHYTSLNQSYKGTTTFGDTETEFNTKLRAGYVSVPLLFCVNPSSDHGFFFECGPQFSFLVHASESFTASSRDAEEANFSRTNKEGLAPINYQFAINSGKIWNIGYNGALHVGLKVTYTFNQAVSRPSGPYQNIGAMLYTGFTLRARDHYN